MFSIVGFENQSGEKSLENVKLRHLLRYQEIAAVLIRNGLGFIFFEYLGLGSKWTNAGVDLIQLGQRIRQILGELGPVFIKIGQFASTRPDIIPKPILRELEKLQDKAPPIPFAEIKLIVEKELGAPLHGLFAEFEPTPLATASIGQVHYAILHNGESVAVKVQRLNIMTVIQTDLEIMKDIIPLIEQRFPKLKNYSLQGFLREFSGWLEKELNYRIEGDNAEKIAEGFFKGSEVIIPRIYWDFTTKRVLTMAYVEGVKLNDRQKIADLNYDRKKIADNLSKALFLQILRGDYFHGDPHPGNIFILPGEKIAFVDFGIAGNLTGETKCRFANLISALTRSNTNNMVKALLELGAEPQNIDHNLLRQELDRMVKKHLNVPISHVSLPELVDDLSHMAFCYRIKIPADFILLGKSLLTLEGIIHELNPATSMAELAKQFRDLFIKEQFTHFLRMPSFIINRIRTRLKL
jgi:ubiquinone biosynthesis protein